MSQLKNKIIHALKEKPSRNGWLTGVIIEDDADSQPPSGNDQVEFEVDVGIEPEESFYLNALDLDLTTLLSELHVREAAGR